MTITKENVNQEISKKLSAAYTLILECEKLADEFETKFCFDVAYHMGGTYNGNPLNTWQDQGWNPSNQSC